MPSFFGQTNNSDPESIKRTDTEIATIVEYLFQNGEKKNTNNNHIYRKSYEDSENGICSIIPVPIPGKYFHLFFYCTSCYTSDKILLKQCIKNNDWYKTNHRSCSQTTPLYFKLGTSHSYFS